MISLFVIDDHEVVITGIKAVLSKYKEFSIVGTSNDGKGAFDQVLELNPDIIIMDVMLPDISGIELTQKIIHSKPDSKIILHTSYIDEENIVNGFNSGAMGYVPKNFSTSELVDAIKIVAAGEKYLTGIVSQIVVNTIIKSNQEGEVKKNKEGLSEREREVIKYIASGLLNKEIADKLNVSLRTVEAHKSNILKKLNLTTKADLIIYAIKNKIIKI